MSNLKDLHDLFGPVMKNMGFKKVKNDYIKLVKKEIIQIISIVTHPVGVNIYFDIRLPYPFFYIASPRYYGSHDLVYVNVKKRLKQFYNGEIYTSLPVGASSEEIEQYFSVQVNEEYRPTVFSPISVETYFKRAQEIIFPYFEKAQDAESVFAINKELSEPFMGFNYDFIIRQAFYLKKYKEGCDLIRAKLKSHKELHEKYEITFPNSVETNIERLKDIAADFEPFLRAERENDFYWIDHAVSREALCTLGNIKTYL